MRVPGSDGSDGEVLDAQGSRWIAAAHHVIRYCHDARRAGSAISDVEDLQN